MITSNIFIATAQMRNEDTVLHGTTSALKGSKNLPKTVWAVTVISYCFNINCKIVHSKVAFSACFHQHLQLQIPLIPSVLRKGKMITLYFWLLLTSPESRSVIEFMSWEIPCKFDVISIYSVHEFDMMLNC